MRTSDNVTACGSMPGHLLIGTAQVQGAFDTIRQARLRASLSNHIKRSASTRNRVLSPRRCKRHVRVCADRHQIMIAKGVVSTTTDGWDTQRQTGSATKGADY